MKKGLPPRCALVYEVESALSEGGQGVVWLARHRTLDRQVVIKVIRDVVLDDAKHVERFLAEGRTTASLTHPNIVKVLDQDVEDTIPWMAYEYVPGGDLSDKAAKGPMPVEEASAAMIQVLSALQEAHAHGILHRDIKPSNILCSGDGQYKVADFGLARRADATCNTTAGAFVGTLRYLAPEYISGKPFTASSDLYSVGITFFELITGRRVFDAQSTSELVVAQLMHPPPKPRSICPHIPQSIEDVILWTLAKQPESRPRSAEELAGAIVTALGLASNSKDLPRVHPPPRPLTPPVERIARWVRTGPVSTPLILGVALVVGVSVGVLWGPYPRAHPPPAPRVSGPPPPLPSDEINPVLERLGLRLDDILTLSRPPREEWPLQSSRPTSPATSPTLPADWYGRTVFPPNRVKVEAQASDLATDWLIAGSLAMSPRGSRGDREMLALLGTQVLGPLFRHFEFAVQQRLLTELNSWDPRKQDATILSLRGAVAVALGDQVGPMGVFETLARERREVAPLQNTPWSAMARCRVLVTHSDLLVACGRAETAQAQRRRLHNLAADPVLDPLPERARRVLLQWLVNDLLERTGRFSKELEEDARNGFEAFKRLHPSRLISVSPPELAQRDWLVNRPLGRRRGPEVRQLLVDMLAAADLAYRWAGQSRDHVEPVLTLEPVIQAVVRLSMAFGVDQPTLGVHRARWLQNHRGPWTATAALLHHALVQSHTRLGVDLANETLSSLDRSPGVSPGNPWLGETRFAIECVKLGALYHLERNSEAQSLGARLRKERPTGPVPSGWEGLMVDNLRTRCAIVVARPSKDQPPTTGTSVGPATLTTGVR